MDSSVWKPSLKLPGSLCWNTHKENILFSWLLPRWWFLRARLHLRRRRNLNIRHFEVCFKMARRRGGEAARARWRGGEGEAARRRGTHLPWHHILGPCQKKFRIFYLLPNASKLKFYYNYKALQTFFDFIKILICCVKFWVLLVNLDKVLSKV